MGYLDHIAACNVHDIDRFRPFVADRRHIGWIRRDTVEKLAAFPDVFRIRDDSVTLHPRLGSPDERSGAIDAVAVRLANEWGYPGLRGERYAVAPRWGEPPVMTIDRGVVSAFGVRAYGVHVNGIVRRPDGPFLWVSRRAPDRLVAPGKLDNMIAGGQPAHLNLADNLVKEAAEEADVPETLARTARPVGAITYCLEDEWGLKPDVMFCFDLEVPDGFSPRNTDGEISGFTLMPVAEVAERVRDSDAFKFNVNLVIMDFLIRHGVLSPENEPDYVDIVRGLRRGW
ncbi:MAG: DUF4743 domain-containing protein [Magnetospirillum sp.]|nr:DUF4743 domain-containing protein [Magnetospirillum sp.]